MKTIVFLFVLLFWQQNMQAQQNRQTDSLALVNLYNATAGANWFNPWVLSQPMNNWRGVILNADGRVYEVHLYQQNLVGTLPDLNLPEIIHLHLGRNLLSDTIPDFNHMIRLTSLNLSYNQLKGAIPNFNKLYNLQNLYLGNNQLTGGIPDFGSIPQLVQLSLDDNQLTGNIPNFGNLPQLTYCNLSDNSLVGTLPSFANSTRLISLYLGDNDLTGTVAVLSNLVNLRTLDLRNNRLEGAIGSFDYSPGLQYLSIAGNQYTFENILPIIDTMLARNFIARIFPTQYLTNQDSVGSAQTYAISRGSSYTIDLGIDDTVSTNVYYWYHNGVLIDSTFGVNEYTIANFQAIDAGSYTVTIKNTIMPLVYDIRGFELYTRPIVLSIGTGVEQLAIEPLEVKPNPVSSMLWIGTETIKGELNVRVIDWQGRVIIQQQIEGGSVLPLDMKEYPAGIYIIRIQQSNKIWQEKVVKI